MEEQKKIKKGNRKMPLTFTVNNTVVLFLSIHQHMTLYFNSKVTQIEKLSTVTSHLGHWFP